LHVKRFITEGFKESAEKFRLESGIQPSIDLNQLDDRIRIREEIQNGRIESAISLVNSLHPELLDNDRYLYFHLQVCTFLVLALFFIVVCNISARIFTLCNHE